MKTLKGSRLTIVAPGKGKVVRRVHRLGRGIVRFWAKELAGHPVVLELERKKHVPRLNSKYVRLSNSNLHGREVELYAIDVTRPKPKHVHKFSCTCGRRHK